jgi:hypothetical protein
MAKFCVLFIPLDLIETVFFITILNLIFLSLQTKFEKGING